MKSKYFLDTCVFIYSFQKEVPNQMDKAKELIKTTLKSNRGIISFQVIQEFLNEALYRFKQPIKPLDCKIYISNFLSPMCEIFPTIYLYKGAIDIGVETGLNFDMSLKVAAALQGNTKVIYSDRFQTMFEIKGIKVINPFEGA